LSGYGDYLAVHTEENLEEAFQKCFSDK